MQKIKENDEVIVIAGKDKGKKGKVKKVFRKTDRVLVEGVNVVKKAIRPSKQNPTGGIIDIESSIHKSNVALVDPKTGRPTRIRIGKDSEKTTRIAVKSGTVLS